MNVMLRVKRFEKIKDENGENQLKVIEEKYEKVKSKYLADQIKFLGLKTEFVESPPKEFKFNTLYIRKDGKTAWFYGEAKS